MTKTIAFTTFALVAFALNSILCRLALRGEEIDAASFTGVRLVSGAAVMVLVSYLVGRRSDTGVRGIPRGGSWLSAVFLFTYAICFSLAYLGLTAGTGALILFGSVQMTMVAIAIGRGERPRPFEWIGLLTAVGGLVYLVQPGLSSPPLNSSLLMAAAGASWGIYTIIGKGTADPLASTTGNFIRTLPFAIIAAVAFIPNLHLSHRGIILAVLSGGIASGIGYTVWYAALRHLTMARAAILQLAVPVIAAVLGITLLGETATPRLYIAAGLILGGIGLTIFGRKP
ncbi:MAG: DMT family transporter [Acidobacteriota bacterium]